VQLCLLNEKRLDDLQFKHEKRVSRPSETNEQEKARLKTNRVHNSQALLSETEQQLYERRETD